MKSFVLSLILFGSFSLANCQNLRLVSNLPSFINETSGIVAPSTNGIWTHNDSGDGPIIYKIDSNGNLIDSIYLTGVTAIDFEDITRDNLGNYYIGDIGNNGHNRTNLVIYKIPNPDSIVGNSVTPQAIHYSYQDQIQFPDPNKNSDCEALFHYQGSLYLISKNWGSSGQSKLYQLPDSAGTHTAMLIDSFASGLITAADIHPSGKLAVLGMDRLFIFDNFTGNDFFGGTQSIMLFPVSQKEGVCFIDSNTVFITQEHHSFFPGAKLFELVLGVFLDNIEIEHHLDVSTYPNPAGDYLNVNINSFHSHSSKVNCNIYDANGRRVKSIKFKKKNEINIPLFNLPKGTYYIEVRIKKQRITKPFIKN